MASKAGRPLRFVLVGIINTLVDFGLFLLLSALGVAVVPANMVATGVALCVGFLLNRKFTFDAEDGALLRQVVLFLMVTLVGLWVLQPVVLLLLVPVGDAVLPHAHPLVLTGAKLAATVVSMAWNWLLYSRIVF